MLPATQSLRTAPSEPISPDTHQLQSQHQDTLSSSGSFLADFGLLSVRKKVLLNSFSLSLYILKKPELVQHGMASPFPCTRWRSSPRIQGSELSLWEVLSPAAQMASPCSSRCIAFTQAGMWSKFTFHSINLVKEGVFFPLSPSKRPFFFFFLMTFLKHLIFWEKGQMIYFLGEQQS